MDITTKNGQVLTEEMINELGEACERGEYPGTPGDFIIAPKGRPPLYPDEELVTVAFKVPRSRIELLDKRAAEKRETRSQFMRELLDDALMAG
ncbi:MAG: CopG family transcriptional regulator [Coriobacteriia bacterium]|nr:CopG family transcriptional regulator [Coriobacteriia bacterium]MCL2750477.1 CopG family transcriptional regulator [Coriobacteriia bacterium]